jgi:hypothetical protein
VISRSRLACFVIPVLTASIAAAESHPSWWNLADPDATSLVGLQWQTLRDSPFGAALQTELTTSLGFPDLPVLQNARQFLISSPSLLAVVSGDMPPRTIQEQASASRCKPAAYRGIGMWICPSTTLSVAQLSDQLVLLGLRKTLEQAIDRSLAETGRRYSSLLARAARVSRGRDLWVVATQLPDPLASIFVPIEAEAKGFDGGVSLREGLQLEASLETGSEDAAEAVAASLRDVMPSLPVLARGMQVSVQEHNVIMALQVGKDEFLAGLRPTEPTLPAPVPAAAQTAAIVQPAPVIAQPALGEAPIAPVRATPESAKPQEPLMIRIFGLDDGPREIPLVRPEKP